MTTSVQQLIFAGLYSGRQFKVIGHLPLGAWLKQDDENSALCLHVQRLFHSLAAFAFHHTRLDVAVLEPKRSTCVAKNGFTFHVPLKFQSEMHIHMQKSQANSNIDARVITIITNPLFVNVIRRNKRNELLEKFSFNTILLMMMMMVEHLDKLVNSVENVKYKMCKILQYCIFKIQYSTCLMMFHLKQTPSLLCSLCKCLSDLKSDFRMFCIGEH
ncbi:hypothetical protein T12_170 [Trichinella patagoniensis]|uniref:Uncharacterized protein n=1 Tax=Trichinella patagoniensis TaxID=990121 RepID=A0A0V1ADV7_9BILA|nr:hypothetical protein T12_170 [Trichinella patagoniensis]